MDNYTVVEFTADDFEHVVIETTYSLDNEQLMRDVCSTPYAVTCA